MPGWPNLVHCNLKYCNIGYSNHIQYLRLQGLNYLELQIDSDFIPDIYETLNCLISLSLIIFESIHVQLWFKKKNEKINIWCSSFILLSIFIFILFILKLAENIDFFSQPEVEDDTDQ